MMKAEQYTLSVATEFDIQNPPTIKSVRRRLAKMARAVPEGATVSIEPITPGIRIFPPSETAVVLTAKWRYWE